MTIRFCTLSRRRLAHALLAIGLGSLASGALAQAWPSKPIRAVVPFAAGGVADVVARAVLPRLSEALGQPIVIDNRGGAGGTLGTAIAAKAPADGYTLLVPAASHATTPGLYTKLPFDPVGDFAAVTQIVTVPYLLVVNPSVPAKDVREFIALAKSRPGQLTYGSAGNGSSNHLAGELFESMAGVDLLHTPYKGSGPALTDVIGGHLTFMFDTINTSIGHIRAGQLRVLGVGTARRSQALPDVPTIADAGGLPGYEAATWIGLLAPAGTPREIVTRLNREIVAILQQPDVRERLAAQGAEPVGSSPEQFEAFVKAEIAKWGKVIRDANIKPVE